MNLKISVEVVDDHGRCRQCKRRIIGDRVVCDVDRVVPRHDLDFAGHQRLVRALHFKFDEMMNAALLRSALTTRATQSKRLTEY